MPHGWKAVEMPVQIAALPRERKGFPIPYVAEWQHSENPPHTLEENGNILRMDCDCIVGVGEPELGKQCPTRQRECMSERKCQVCSYPIGVDADCALLGGEEIETYIEPALHIECARYSLLVCPGITRRPGMSIHICREYELFDKLDFPQYDATIMAPTGQVPIQVALGLMKGGFAFHGARPVGGKRYLAADWLSR